MVCGGNHFEERLEPVAKLVTRRRRRAGPRDRARRQRLRAKGVEFTQEATDHGYGVDCGLRDPFGNQIRILQPKAWQG
jgi:hypothetical protein